MCSDSSKNPEEPIHWALTRRAVMCPDNHHRCSAPGAGFRNQRVSGDMRRSGSFYGEGSPALAVIPWPGV